MINLAITGILAFVITLSFVCWPYLHCSVYWRLAGWDGCLHKSYTASFAQVGLMGRKWRQYGLESGSMAFG
jgi:hypothetical protein